MQLYFMHHLHLVINFFKLIYISLQFMPILCFLSALCFEFDVIFIWINKIFIMIICTDARRSAIFLSHWFVKHENYIHLWLISHKRAPKYKFKNRTLFFSLLCGFFSLLSSLNSYSCVWSFCLFETSFRSVTRGEGRRRVWMTLRLCPKVPFFVVHICSYMTLICKTIFKLIHLIKFDTLG